MGHLVSRVASYTIGGVPPGIHLGLPSPTLTLVISLDESLQLSGGPVGPAARTFRVSLAGLHATPVAIHHGGSMRGIQLDLTPAGARSLLGCPAAELAGRVVELEEVIGGRADRSRDLLHDVADGGQRSALLRHLFGRGPLAPPMDARLAAAWQRLHTSHGQARIADLATDAGLSPRHFTQLFTREFGQRPKTTARVIRFQRSRAMLRAGLPSAAVAARCGYTDQAHLVREWRDLAGTTPGRWPLDDDLAFVQDCDSAAAAG